MGNLQSNVFATDAVSRGFINYFYHTIWVYSQSYNLTENVNSRHTGGIFDGCWSLFVP